MTATDATPTVASVRTAGGRPHPARWLVPAAAAALGALVAWVMREALYDDALITLAFARNLATDGCWCLSPGLTVHTATSPLNVWLLAAVAAVTGHPMWSVAVVSAAGYAQAAVWLRALAGTGAALLGVALLATAPIVVQAVGMESLLGVLCLLAIARYGRDGRWWAVLPAVAATPLVRPDLVLGAVAAVAVLAAVRREVGRPVLALVGGALATTPWWAWSWWALGSVWPDTLPVKAGLGEALEPLAVLKGFLLVWPAESGLTLAALLLGVACALHAARRGEWAPAALVSGGVADLAAMTATATNPATYYGAIVTGSALLAVALALPSGRASRSAGVALLAASLVWFALSAPSMLGGYHPWRQNGATNAQYASIAAALPRDAAVLSENEIGALAYYCLDAGCRVVDELLADPGRVAQRVAPWRTARPWTGWNYVHHRTPLPVVTPWRLVTRRTPPLPSGWPATGADRREGVIVLERAATGETAGP